LNKIVEFKCETYIISGYLHSSWNLERYCVTLPKPKSNTIPTSYCDNIVNHGTNEGVVITRQNFIEVTVYHQCGQYCDTLMYVYQQFCIGPLSNFYHLWVWKYLSTIFNVYLKFLAYFFILKYYIYKIVIVFNKPTHY